MTVVEDLRAGIPGTLLLPAVAELTVTIVAVEAQVGHLVKVITIIVVVVAAAEAIVVAVAAVAVVAAAAVEAVVVVVAVDVKVKSGETDLLFSHGKNKLWNV